MQRSFFVLSVLVLLMLTSSLPAQAQGGFVPAPAEPVPEIGDVVDGEYIIALTDDIDDAEKVDNESKRLVESFGGEITEVYDFGFHGFAVRGMTKENAELIKADAKVEAIEENSIFGVESAGTQFSPPSWGIDRIDQRMLLPNDVYMYDHMGTGVNVYVIDTGILTGHVDLAPRARWLTDCTGQGFVDNHGHGTAMAGIIGGTNHGVAKASNLVAVKVIRSNGTGTLSQVLCGMVRTLFDVVLAGNQPAVANMALIGRPSFILDLVLNISTAFGIPYVVPAGNFSQSACNFSPARVPGALTLAASTFNAPKVQDLKARFSNFGSCVDLFAPGEKITTTSNANIFATQTISGTSASTAHGAGVAAAWREASPGLSPSALFSTIVSTATAGKISDPMGSPNLLLYKKLVPSPSIDQAPAGERVYDFIALGGSGFGTYTPGTTKLLFFNSATTIEAPVPYVWRDDFIRSRVPVGDLIAGTPTAIPKTAISIMVTTGTDFSNKLPFQVTTSTATLSFQELTQIVSNTDVSNVLGSPNMNLRRTKDGEVGDVDGDGWPDLVDNNSVNIRNQHHSVVHFNNGNKTFSAIELEPFDAGDVGFFLTVVPPGGTYLEDATTYDSDLVDLDNDGFPEIVQALRNHGATGAPCPANATTQLVRVLVNNSPSPGFFVEASPTWFGSQTFPGMPDDVDHWDANNDGFVDVAVSYRFTSFADVFLNQVGASFASGIRLTGGGSMHDIFFLDANADGFEDVIAVNESGNSFLFLNNGAGGYGAGSTISFANALSGVAADFNLDGLDDFALVRNVATVFLNNPAAPGTFTTLSLPNPTGLLYDVEAGDIDLDGSTDLIAVSITSVANNVARVWLNNGTGTAFTEITGGVAGSLLPGVGAYQRLSADLIDLDLDGDLDLYLTGADGQDVGPPTGCSPGPFGRTPNQLWENLLVP